MGGAFESFYTEDNILFAKDNTGYRILDDKNLEGDTLGLRRLKLELRASKSEVYPLKRQVSTFVDLVKYSAKYKFYIDYTGSSFKYEKTRYVSLVFKPINFRKYVDGKGTLFTVRGVNNWFEVPRLLPPETRYAILLKIDQSYVLYGLSETKGLDSRRMV